MAHKDHFSSSSGHVSEFVSTFCVCRVLDEVLQKLVQLIQEEECVSLCETRCINANLALWL